MRILINCADNEKSMRAPIQKWCRTNSVAAQVTYGHKTLEVLLRKVRAYEMDMLLVSCPETMFSLVGKNAGTQSDWAGSVLWKDCPILIINPLKQVQTMPEGHWLLQQHLNKIPAIIRHKKPEDHPYKIVQSGADARCMVSELQQYPYLVQDIETCRNNGITSIGYTPIDSSLSIKETYVLNLSQPELSPLWKYARLINAQTSYKIFHNGTFDAYQQCRWYMPPRNYILDTEYMWHSWYAEIKKSLAFVANTVLWDARYWKHEAAASPLAYNAKDCINTARIFIYFLNNMPDWAWKNYSKLVPNIAPAVWCSFEGFKVDYDKLTKTTEEAKTKKAALLSDLRLMAAEPGFNPNSVPQVSQWLYKILGAHKPVQRGPKKGKGNTGTDAKTLAKVSLQHPLFARIISTLIEYRNTSKAISTYYTARLTPGHRLLYSFKIDGTETERFSCSASSLYAPLLSTQTLSTQQNYGTQLQNIPPYMKLTLTADEGFSLVDIDKNKAEAFCTAHISQDEVFLADLLGELDFYLALGNRLFGLSIDDKEHPLRQVFKKINHSTSYMAGGYSLLDSIGPENVFKYIELLEFKGTPIQFAEKCIKILLKSYKRRKEWWDETRAFAKNFGYIETPDGHHRHVFDYGKRHIPHNTLRGLVAHQPQHLSVAGLNEAFWKIWYLVQLPSNGEVRLKGQVHDSVVAQIKDEKVEHYQDIILKKMDIPQTTALGEMRIPLESSVSKYWKETKT